jgi:hypothetical protein
MMNSCVWGEVHLSVEGPVFNFMVIVIKSTKGVMYENSEHLS